jgi:hypothetical protein
MFARNKDDIMFLPGDLDLLLASPFQKGQIFDRQVSKQVGRDVFVEGFRRPINSLAGYYSTHQNNVLELYGVCGQDELMRHFKTCDTNYGDYGALTRKFGFTDLVFVQLLDAECADRAMIHITTTSAVQFVHLCWDGTKLHMTRECARALMTKTAEISAQNLFDHRYTQKKHYRKWTRRCSQLKYLVTADPKEVNLDPNWEEGGF